MLELVELKEMLLKFTKHYIENTDKNLKLSKKKLPVVSSEIQKRFSAVDGPGKKASYNAALEYLSGQLKEDSRLFDLLAFALHQPISELSDQSIVSENEKLSNILARYKLSIKNKKFKTIVWFGLLQAYFQFDVVCEASEKLRDFLESTLDSISELSKFKPLWMSALISNKQILTSNPCSQYAREWLSGNTEGVDRIKSDISIPDNSWFWSELVVSCIKETTMLNDDDFKQNITRLLEFLEVQHGYLDIWLPFILERYRNCKHAPLNNELKDFSIHHWKSPKLRNVGGSKWFQVDEKVWRMVLGWVNEANLRLFFSLLERNGVADKNRLNFWLKYIEQVSWTKIVIGDETLRYLKRDKEMVKVFENDSESFSYLTGEADLDAFIMKIGNYLIVEFSTEGGCYVYSEGENTFDPNKKNFNASTAKGGLKEKWKKRRAPDIVHRQDWQPKAEAYLRKLFIYPDVVDNNKRKPKENGGSVLSQESLNISKHASRRNHQATSGSALMLKCEQGQSIADSCGVRTENFLNQGGAFWVYLEDEEGPIANILKSLDFKFKHGRGWWIK